MPQPTLIAAALLGWTTLAAAQGTPAAPEAAASEPATAAALPEVKARAPREAATGPVSGYRATRSATATKTDTPLNQVPQAISVISADQITDQASQNLQEVLRYTAGVRADMYGVDNRGDWFTMRGGSEGSTLLDGLRLPLSGWWGVVRNEPYAFERIEVLRGPASVVAGQNGPGGVVNLVSKRPQATPQREVAVQFGSYDHKQVSADLTGPLNEDGSLLYRVVALAKDSGTQVNHAFDERSFFAPSLSWKPNADTTFTAFAEYQRDESGNVNAFFPFEGTIAPAPNGPLPFDTFIGEPDWDTYGGTRTRAGYHFEHKLGGDWRLRHNLRHDRVDGKMRTMYADWSAGFRDANGNADPNGTYLNREWYANDDEVRITNADLLLEGQLRLGSTQHTLLAGVDGMSQRADQWSWGGVATPLDVYNPVYGSFALPVLSRDDVPVARTRTRRVGVLVQDQVKFGERWVLVAALRHDKARVEGDAAPQEDSATTRNLGAVYLAEGGLSPYASYSESFEPVAPEQGTLYKPQRGRQFEVGIKWQPASPRLTASAAAYQLRERNRKAPGATPADPSVQRGEVTVTGLELEAAGHLPAWDLLASYTYANARVTRGADNELDQQLYGIPRHSAALWALHRFGSLGLPGLRAGLGVRHIGKTGTGDAGVPVTVPAVTLLDALIAYDRGDWRFALNANNLSDKTYIAACLSRGDCWFGAKRKVIGTVAYRF